MPNTYSLSPFKVVLCLVLYATEQCNSLTLVITPSSKSQLAAYISKVIREGLYERNFLQLKNEMQELSPDLSNLLHHSLQLLCD